MINNLESRVVSFMDVNMDTYEFCDVDSNILIFNSPNDDQIVEDILVEEGLVEKNESIEDEE